MLKNSLLLFGLLFFTSSYAQQWNGYFLVASNSIQNGTSAALYDTSYNAYHTWTGLSEKTGYSSYLLPGGTLLRSVKGNNAPSGSPMGPICGKIQKHDYNGNLIWDYMVAGTDYVSHHDIQPMPNGNVLAIVYERKTAAEATAAGKSNSTAQMWPDMIMEIQPTGPTTGTVVWEWHTWDHLVQNVDNSKANYKTSIVDNPQLININYKPASDWQHMNGIDYNPILDQIVFSSHNLNEWYVIDHSTTTAEAASHSGGNSGKGGDILYRWGNPAAYEATGAAVLNVTHDSHWADEFSTVPGRICGFNNRGVSTNQSAADQIIPPVNGYNYTLTAGQAYLPATYDARNTNAGIYSSNMGGTQQLPNGNELVCEATAGTIWEFNNTGGIAASHTFTGSLPQCKKYSACYITNAPPSIPTISLNGTNLVSSTATTYQWYKDGVKINGATNSAYTPTATGIYVVRITDANGCVHQYSKGYSYVKPNSVSNVIDLSNEIVIYPNPTTGFVRIKNVYAFGNNFTVNIYDNYGKQILNKKNASSVDLSSFANGIYSIQIISEKGIATQKLILNN